MNAAPVRVVAYVDGFNLFFGLRTARLKRFYWLDVQALATNLLKPGQALVGTHYFTSRIRDDGTNDGDRKRQATYIDALKIRGIAIHEGHYLIKTRTCRQCGSQWTDYEEKETDVNIATQLLVDAFDDVYDVALVLSGDSDLTTPIRRVRERFGAKRVIVAFPPRRNSAELRRHASGFLTIGEDKIRVSQLPDVVVTPEGFELHRPDHWADAQVPEAPPHEQ